MNTIYTCSILLQTQISNIVRSSNFWNNIYQVRLKAKDTILNICIEDIRFIKSFKITSHDRIVKEEFEDTKGVLRICKSKKNKQHNGQNKRTKGQTTIYKTYIKTKERVTRTLLETGDELMCSGRFNSSCSTSDTLLTI